jgi:hypothetical protein
MLTNSKTKLKFNNFMSEWFIPNNGIGQGDPLSMILYLFYNVDLLNITKGINKKSLGYVDDDMLVAITKSFKETHRILKSMMILWGGGFMWSKSHNSSFETTKSKLIDFACSKTVKQLPLILQGKTILPQKKHTQVHRGYTRSGAAMEPPGRLHNSESGKMDRGILLPHPSIIRHPAQTHAITIQLGGSSQNDLHSCHVVHTNLQTQGMEEKQWISRHHASWHLFRECHP